MLVLLPRTSSDFLYVPPGGIHAFRNTSGSEASMLIVFTPGALREVYVAELTETRAAGRNLTNEEWDEVDARRAFTPAVPRTAGSASPSLGWVAGRSDAGRIRVAPSRPRG